MKILRKKAVRLMEACGPSPREIHYISWNQKLMQRSAFWDLFRCGQPQWERWELMSTVFLEGFRESTIYYRFFYVYSRCLYSLENRNEVKTESLFCFALKTYDSKMFLPFSSIRCMAQNIHKLLFMNSKIPIIVPAV